MIDKTERVWLTTPQVCERTQYGRDVVLDAAATGDLPSFQRVPGAPRRYHVDDVDRWVRGESPSPVVTRRAG